MSVSDLRSAKRLRKYKKAFSIAGWNLNFTELAAAQFDDEFDGPVFYLVNLELGNYLLVSGPSVEIFDQVSMEMKKTGLDYETVCDSFGSLFTDICGGKVKLDAEGQGILLAAAAMYISGTQGYKISVQRGFKNPHFLIISQWDYGNNMRLLRPVPLNSPGILPPEEIETLVDQVIAQDRINHPERFGSAKLLPFTIKE